MTGPFTDDELDRYARHIVLREVGGPGQKRLKAARVLCVGAGGLGSPALLYLAAAGIGALGVIDDDTVSLSNLQRQILHATPQIGALKTDSAAEALTQLNPNVAVETIAARLTPDTADAVIGAYDLVLDGCDNFDTRYLVNRTARRLGKTVVSGAIGQWDGQVAVYKPGGPCYECVFPERPAAHLAPNCAQAGVIGALPGVVGSLMAMEAIKEIVRAGETLAGRILLYDALGSEFRTMAVQTRADCPVCGGEG